MKQKMKHKFRVAAMFLQKEVEVNDSCISLRSLTTQIFNDFTITTTSEVRHVRITDSTEIESAMVG
jgi:hypothetical protein